MATRSHHLLSILMNLQDEDGSRMTDQQIRDEVLTACLGGFETTALALTWSWYLFSKHPEIRRKMVAEIDEVLGAGFPKPPMCRG